MEITIADLKEISRLSRKSINELRNLNVKMGRSYNGRELTKYQLIFQIVFRMDAPDKHT